MLILAESCDSAIAWCTIFLRCFMAVRLNRIGKNSLWDLCSGVSRHKRHDIIYFNFLQIVWLEKWLLKFGNFCLQDLFERKNSSNLKRATLIRRIHNIYLLIADLSTPRQFWINWSQRWKKETSRETYSRSYFSRIRSFTLFRVFPLVNLDCRQVRRFHLAEVS